jgi:DNA polymerase-3 subunit delta'
VTSSDTAPRTTEPWARFGQAGERLRRALAEGRIGPAYLLEGPDEEVAREGARLFAAGLLCAADGGRPCLRCDACRRAVSGSHPDLHLQGRDKATVISVEAMEPLLARAHLAPLEGTRQAFVIEPADALAPEGVARYLKTLEEPPLSSTFLLVTARPDRLPDAVRSRCQRVRFAAPSEEAIAARLASDGVDPERARRIARTGGASHARSARIARAGTDEVALALVRAALDPAPAAATSAEAALETLRRGTSAAPPRADAGAEGETPVPAGEAVREALEDLFQVLQALARDRAAGLPGGLPASVDPDAASRALSDWARLSTFVRRNVTPAALVIEATAVLRRAAGVVSPARAPERAPRSSKP